MVDRHVTATLALLCLGGLVLVVWPLFEGPGFSVSLLLAACLVLWASARVTVRLGPWRGAFAGWLLGALVPVVATLGVSLWELLDGHVPEAVRTPDGWSDHCSRAAVLGAAFFAVQLAPRAAAPWRRLLVSLLAVHAYLASWLVLALAEVYGAGYRLEGLAVVVAVVGCLRGVDHTSDVLRPLRRLTQRLAGLEPRDPEFDLDAVEPLGGRRRERA